MLALSQSHENKIGKRKNDELIIIDSNRFEWLGVITWSLAMDPALFLALCIYWMLKESLSETVQWLENL